MRIRAWAMIGLFSMLQILALMFPHTNRLLDFYGSPMVIEFELGMLVALLYLSQVRIPTSVILLAVAVSAAIVGLGVHNGASKGVERTLYWGVAGVGLLITCVFVERQWSWPRINILRRLGDASYAMYVSGIFSLSLVTHILQKLQLAPITGRNGALLLLMTGVIAGGFILHHLIEEPLADFLSHQLLPSTNTRLGSGTTAAAPQTGPKLQPQPAHASGIIASLPDAMWGIVAAFAAILGGEVIANEPGAHKFFRIVFIVCVLLIGVRGRFLVAMLLGFGLDLAVELSVGGPLIDYVNPTAAPYWRLAIGLMLFATSFLVVWLYSASNSAEKFMGKLSLGGAKPLSAPTSQLPSSKIKN